MLPGETTNQRIVEANALEGRGVRELSQLQKLKQDRSFRQIGDEEACFRRRHTLHLDVQVGRPLALEFFAGQSQAFVGSLNVAQGGPRQITLNSVVTIVAMIGM